MLYIIIFNIADTAYTERFMGFNTLDDNAAGYNVIHYQKYILFKIRRYFVL